MASLWADYTFHETALSGLTVGAGARYIGNTVTYYSSASPKAYESFNVAGYALADATVKYDLARFGLPGSSVGVNVNNIFDREYVSSCYSEYACYWGAGRRCCHGDLPLLTSLWARFAVPFYLSWLTCRIIKRNPTPPSRSTISPFAYPGALCCIRSL